MIRTACLSHVLSHTIHSNNRSYTHRSGSFTHSYLRIGHKQFFSHMQFLHIYVNSKVKQQVNDRMNERPTDRKNTHTHCIHFVRFFALGAHGGREVSILFSFYQYCVEFCSRIGTRFPLTSKIISQSNFFEIMHLAASATALQYRANAAGGRARVELSAHIVEQTSQIYHMSRDSLLMFCNTTNQSKIYMQNNENEQEISA